MPPEFLIEIAEDGIPMVVRETVPQ